MKKRIVAALLTLSMVLSLMTPAMALEGDPVTLTSDGAAVDVVTVCKYTTGEDRPVTVTAETDDADASFRWQFLMEDLDMWVNIYGEEASDCVLTYAKVCNMLDENEEARMRCVVTLSDGTVYGQDGELDFTVKVDEETIPELPEPEALKPQVLSGFEVLFPEIDIPEIELPEIEIPEIDIPQWPDLPELPDMPGFPEFPDYPTDFPLFPLEPSSPAEETPVTPSEETPVTPSEETPVTPSEETPVTPSEETPVTPSEETPVAPSEETPVAPSEETPVAPSEEAPVAPSEETPVVPSEETPVTPSEETPVVPSEETSAAPAEETPAAPSEDTVPEDSESYVMTASAIHYRNNTKHNVIINYVFQNGEIVADPYTASLAAGSNFSATVTFPTVRGYLPYVNEAQQDSIELNYTGIDQDYTINVVYKPTNVGYTVIHYQQNLNDDNYTEMERETKQGLTNSIVPDVAKKYEGFYSLLYEKPAIAADGSTLVEVYYDRYYCLMNFDLDGGYGVEPIYARYGTPIGDVGTPTKAGYTFGGWSKTEGDTTAVDLPATMPAENKTYHAIWTPEGTAKVTVVFWGENADDEEYSYIKSAQVNVKPGTEFTYNESGSLVCALEVHTHSLQDCYELTCTQEEHTHSDKCNTCGQTEHTIHTTACYAGVGKKQNVLTDVPYNPEEGQVTNHWVYGKLIYIGGSWYRYSGSTEDGKIAPTTCHKHDDTCLGCGKTEHTHTDYTGSCYTLTCTKTEHTHTSNCYMSGAGLDSNLWKFEKSDTVTVAADGSSVVNVYYDRTEKTLTFKYNYSKRNGYQSTDTITAKWGSDISKQYKEIATKADSTFWSAETSGKGPYTNYFGVMPQTSATYYNRGKTGDTGTMTYWGQDLNGDYTVKLFEVTGVGGYYVTDEDRYEFQGFTYHHGTENDSDCDGATFYYTRNSYTLTFNDGYKDVKTESVLYEAPLSTYSSYVPAVPSAYEPGSVSFGGWYLNPECSGEEYKLDEHTMPADNVLLYAKWVPVSHTVEFYLDQDALNAGKKLYDDITVPHGSKADPTPAAPTNGSYTFVGWFYMDGDQEKAFDFANMPVNKDLQVYGKWSSNVLKPYTIYYKIKETDTEIAAPTTGSGLAGVTKTFEAKGGTDLYDLTSEGGANYQEGYFPMTKSHSLTLDIEDETKNSFTFWYVQKDAVPYTVKYLNKETGEPVADEKTVSDNRKAVVTENFATVPGMMPDAYQKRLVVSVDEDGNPDTEHNVIIFYYTEDTTHAYYKITHYTENLAKDAQGNPTWTEYASSQAVGDIGTTYTADPLNIPGFTYDSTVSGTVASGELTSSGLELKLYYTRNSYPYQVRYLEKDSGKQLANPKNGTGKYGEVVSETAIDIANYTAVAPTSQTLNIKIEEGTEAKLNVITFYYTENSVTINYQVVGPEGCGTVSPTSETVKVLSGTAQGSTATASSDTYRFVGWYTDADCTKPVGSSNGTLDGAKFTPAKVDGKNVAATYYAKFEYNVADLTINKKVASGGEQDTFIFRIVGGSGADAIDMKVTITGNGSVTIKGLKVGNTYTVTEDTNWSWRYSSQCDRTSGEVTITAGGSEITFTNTFENTKWLTDACIVVNNWEKKKNSSRRKNAQGKED